MDALIVVDVQNDFMPGGALAVPDGDAILPVVTSLMEKFKLCVATQDWHPPGHGSFVTEHPGAAVGDMVTLAGLPQVAWPVHCVENTPGAAFHAELPMASITRVFPKGQDPTIDSYSGFFDNGRRASTGLGDYLREQAVDRVFVCGLATDYCVKFTALDAADLGFATYLLTDACRGVNLNPGDVDQAIADMRTAGITCVTHENLPD